MITNDLVSNLDLLLKAALSEDCPSEDLTTALVVGPWLDPVSKGHLIAKESGIFFGADIIDRIFTALGLPVTITHFISDGETFSNQSVITSIEGPLSALLKAERVLLNLLQHLSGIATKTARYKKALGNDRIQLLDIRKTTPLLRFLERKAVVAGGGHNHRENLSTMVLIKENHLRHLEQTGQLGELDTLLSNQKAKSQDILIEIEIETLEQLRQLPLGHADIILLDNFDTALVSQAVEICRERGYTAAIEVSGNITLDTIQAYRELPVDRISCGSLTHSVDSIDISFLIVS